MRPARRDIVIRYRRPARLLPEHDDQPRAQKEERAPPINDIDERLAFEPVAVMLGNRYSPRDPSKRRLLRGTRPTR
jgi:hypothetical protein